MIDKISRSISNRQRQLRSILLSLILVLSVVVVPIAITGDATAQEEPEANFDFTEFEGDTFQTNDTIERSTDLTVSSLNPDNQYTVRMSITGPDGSELDITNPGDVEVNTLTLEGSNSFEVVEQGGSYYIGENGDVATRDGSLLNAASPLSGSLDFTVNKDATVGDYEVSATVVNWDTNEDVSTTSSASITVADLTVDDYASDQGVVDTGGLLDAVDDWRADGITVDFLLEVIDAWRSSG